MALMKKPLKKRTPSRDIPQGKHSSRDIPQGKHSSRDLLAPASNKPGRNPLRKLGR